MLKMSILIGRGMLKQYITEINGMKIYIVDGFKIRKKHVDFTNYGQPLHFKFIPNHEIWIDKENHPNELRFFMKSALLEHKIMMFGFSYDDALVDAAREDIEERKKANQHLEFKREFITEHKGIRVYVVEGDYIRTKIDPFFTEGGHDKVYSYIPTKEIWIDDDVVPKERRYIYFHEYIERRLMKKGYTYKFAHNFASKLEQKKRKIEKGGYREEL